MCQTNSKMDMQGMIGERHYNPAQECRQTLAQYEELKDIISMLGIDQLSVQERNVVNRARRIEENTDDWGQIRFGGWWKNI